MGLDRLTLIVNQVKDKLDNWPSNLPYPTIVIVHESHLPDDFDPNLDKLLDLPVITTLQIRKNSVRLAYLNEQL
jgi:hypothetical protein